MYLVYDSTSPFFIQTKCTCTHVCCEFFMLHFSMYNTTLSRLFVFSFFAALNHLSITKLKYPFFFCRLCSALRTQFISEEKKFRQISPTTTAAPHCCQGADAQTKAFSDFTTNRWSFSRLETNLFAFDLSNGFYV